MASLEGLILLGLTVASWRRLRRLPRALWENPYVTYAFVYSALFVLAFSNFSNFGILARQRVQLLPLFLILLAMPADQEEAVPAARRGRLARPERAPSAVERPAAAPVARGRSAPSPRQLRAYGSPRPEPLYTPSYRAPTRSPGRALAAGSYQALDYRFGVEVAGVARAGEVRNNVVWALRDLAARPGGDHVYRLSVEPDRAGVQVGVGRDGAILGAPAPPWTTVDRLVADVTRAAIASRPDHLLLLAAALSAAGQGLSSSRSVRRRQVDVGRGAGPGRVRLSHRRGGRDRSGDAGDSALSKAALAPPRFGPTAGHQPAGPRPSGIAGPGSLVPSCAQVPWRGRFPVRLLLSPALRSRGRRRS